MRSPSDADRTRRGEESRATARQSDAALVRSRASERASQDAVALFRQIVAQHPRTRYAKSIRTVLSKIDSDNRDDSGNYGDEDDGDDDPDGFDDDGGGDSDYA